MTNKEFYGNKLLAVALKGNCHRLYRMVHGKGCAGLKCKDCEFGETKESEIENILQWLNAEHEEPPLLENGDGLKPGDWIMVRNTDSDAWIKRQFMCYYNEEFFASADAQGIESTRRYYPWNQSRLPMEGE